MDVLSDYIIALIESEDGPPPETELRDHLQVFLYDSTELFVKDLIEFMNLRTQEESENKPNELSNDDEEEVDYEEEVSIETVSVVPSVIKPQRILREYSPERRTEHQHQQKSSSRTQKQPCTNFIKYGNCRFGDNCRYSHLNDQSQIINNPRRRNVSSRVKISKIPISILNPASITEIMKVYGSVVGVTVYPEKCEALVQFTTGDEASSAVEGAVNDFENDNVIIELERSRPPVENNKSSISNDKLQSLISLQKQQQSLLETNLSSQQTLLTHLQSPSLSSEEKAELLGTLKRVQESVMGLQEMVKRTTELVAEAAASGRKQPEKRQKSFERVSFRKNPSYSSHTQNLSYNNNPSYTQNPNYNHTPIFSNNPTFFNSKFNQSNAPQNKFPKNSLDLRPTTLKLNPLNKTVYHDIRSLQSRFSPYGMIQSLILSEGGQTALIKYQKHGDALKAQNSVGKEFEGIEDIEFDFIKQE